MPHLMGDLMELAQQVVVGVDRPRADPRRQTGGPAEIGPVPPAVVDLVPGDAGLFAELIERDVGALLGSEAAEFVEEFGFGGHGGLRVES